MDIYISKVYCVSVCLYKHTYWLFGSAHTGTPTQASMPVHTHKHTHTHARTHVRTHTHTLGLLDYGKNNEPDYFGQY